jgi:signal transduction histidine kinase/tetratricopeptide (TPR) repeat protein
MHKFLVLLAVLYACGLVAVCASGSARALTAADWAKFDTLVANAKKDMMSDPRAALQHARAAAAIAKNAQTSERRYQGVATSLWLEAEALTRINKIAEGRGVLKQAIALASRDGKTTKLDGDLALSLGRIADNDGDIQLALKSFQKAHDIFATLGELRSQSMALQGLGGIYDEAHDFDHEIRYYRRASQVYSKDPALELSVANNVGYALQQLKRYDDAQKDYQRALGISKEMDSPFLQARILTNIADVYAKQHKFDEAEKAANQALKLLGKNDEEGWAPFVWGVKAEVEYERGALVAAQTDLERAFKGVDLTTTIAPFRDMHEIAYRVYRANGNMALALAHHEAFKRLDDQGRSLAASANTALMNAQFDFANQQFEIEHLKSAQLTRDMKLREQNVAIQRMIFAAILLALLAFAAWMGWRQYTMRKHRNAIKRKNTELTRTLGERDNEIMRRTEVENELRDAKRAAELANVAKSHFLANMSHELRTPLNAIIGFSELMTGEVFGPIGNTNYKNYATDINTGGRNLLAVLNDILDMARLDSGIEAVRDSEFAIGDTARDAIESFTDAQRAGKTIHFVGSGANTVLRADEARLRQVMVNLISNAVKYTEPDGLIEVRVEQQPDGIDILITDNGAGIPPDKLSMVLEPFGQVESAYARSHGGVGLGLPIVRAICELHGGRFSMESELDIGTTARIHLPAERIVSLSMAAAS